MKTYESTDHRLRPPPRRDRAPIPHPDTKAAVTGDDDDESSQHRISRYDILSGGVAFVLENFLTVDECKDFIEQAEGFGLTDCGYSKSIRKTDRVAVDASNEVAELLFQRVKPYLKSTKFDLSRKLNTARYPKGVPNSTRPYNWQPVGLNPTFRICRYEHKGFFFPHHDGGFFQNEFNQSLQTFMVYLNDDFDGGETRFYNELQRHYVRPDPDNVVYTYRPKPGDALIFNSQITHDGSKVLKGHKYIMRSEIMYHAANEEEEMMQQQSPIVVEPDHDPDAELTWP